MKVKLLRMNQVFLTPNDSIFTAISTLSQAAGKPWFSIYNPNLMDVEYILNRSGYKPVSPIVEHYFNQGGNSLSFENMTNLATIIYSKYGQIWTKLWETLNLEYDILDTFHEEIMDNESGSSNDQRDYDSTATRTGGTTRTDSSSSDSQDNYHGFNSVSPTPTNGNEYSDLSESRQTYDNLNDRIVYDDDIQRTHTKQNSRTRKGGSSFFTPQDMILKERELALYNFFDKMFSDVDNILTIPIY